MSNRSNIEHLKQKRDTDALINLLQGDDSRARSEAAKALGELRDQRSVKALIAALENRTETSSVRAAAARALGSLGGSQALEPLKAVANDQSATRSVREASSEALRQLGDLMATHSTKPSWVWDSPRVKAILERPEGTPIDLSGLTQEERDALFEDARGMWADHPEITDSVEWVRGLREGLSKRFREN